MESFRHLSSGLAALSAALMAVALSASPALAAGSVLTPSAQTVQAGETIGLSVTGFKPCSAPESPAMHWGPESAVVHTRRRVAHSQRLHGQLRRAIGPSWSPPDSPGAPGQQRPHSGGPDHGPANKRVSLTNAQAPGHAARLGADSPASPAPIICSRVVLNNIAARSNRARTAAVCAFLQTRADHGGRRRPSHLKKPTEPELVTMRLDRPQAAARTARFVRPAGLQAPG